MSLQASSLLGLALDLPWARAVNARRQEDIGGRVALEITREHNKGAFERQTATERGRFAFMPSTGFGKKFNRLYKSSKGT